MEQIQNTEVPDLMGDNLNLEQNYLNLLIAHIKMIIIKVRHGSRNDVFS